MLQKSLFDGVLLPETEEDFEDLFIRHTESARHLACTHCSALFTRENCRSRLEWRETQISGFCGLCWDKTFREPE